MNVSLSSSPSKYCLHILREHDFNRYIASLFAPSSKRSALIAIWAFHCEMTRLAAQVNEPLMGEIRLRWWCDEIEKINNLADLQQNEAQNPLLYALAQAICQFDLPRQHLIGACEAQMRQLYAPTLSGEGEFALYSDETAAVFFQLACQILSVEQAPLATVASYHAGWLEALSQIKEQDLALLPEHYHAFTSAVTRLPRGLIPAFSSLATLAVSFNSREISPLRRLWLISRASITGHFGKLA